MRRAALTLVTTVAGLVLLLSYKTHAGTSLIRPSALAPVAPQARSSGGPAPTTSSGAATGSASTRSIDGQAVDTQFGTVQVRITAKGRHVVGVQPLQLPDSSGRDIMIDNNAVPMLIQETLSAQSAKIDMISGATYTSAGYIQSLQSALDRL